MTKRNKHGEKIRCGVVGVGYLGQHHARIYSGLDGVELIGIYDIDEKRAKEIGALYNIPVYHNLKDLAKDCDAASIVVPTDKHCEVALEFLKHGVHLLIEKPLCTNLQEAEMIVETAKAHHCFVQVGHIEQFNPVTQFLTNAVQNPKFITAERLAPFNPRGTEVGVVLDLMIHDIGVILSLVPSPIEHIEAMGVNVLSNTEDIANARIRFKNNTIANLNASRVSQKKVREIRVFQPMTYLSLDFMHQTGHLIRKVGDQLIKEEIPIEKKEPLVLEIESFINCVQEAYKPHIDAHFGRNALEVALNITQQINPHLVHAL